MPKKTRRKRCVSLGLKHKPKEPSPSCKEEIKPAGATRRGDKRSPSLPG